MSKRNSLNGRLSLSTPNLSSPIAESTHILGLQQKFPWGGVHSPLKVENSPNYSKNLNVSIKKSNFNNTLQKLDPRIYTDVQSQGLASRIVKYYENSRKLHKSLSINNLYKPGQFPVVHLKKNEIPYKHSRNKNSVSVVRIAPPDKSVFQANSRSSILRTGSIVPTVSLGLKQTNNDVARENRPILHPAVDTETAPTRSVLEALKEISRKRINSDELDCNDSIKKYCKESSYDLSSNLTGSVALLPSHQHSSVLVHMKNSTKRNRELTSPSVSPTAKIPNNGQSSNSALIRRRKTNNEFTSSISSSLSLLTPKRKLCEQLSSTITTSIPGDGSVSTGQPKQKQKISFESEKNRENVRHLKKTVFSPSNSRRVLEYVPEKIAEPRKTMSEPVIKTDSSHSESSNHKPKLTLFNKTYENSENYNSKKVMNQDDDENGIPKISFVKPKNFASMGINLAKNAVMEKTQKTKLALMLSGLRGDLNEDQDEVDNSLITEKEKSKTIENENIKKKLNLVPTQDSEKYSTKTTEKDIKSDFSILKDVNKSGTVKKFGGFKPTLDSNKTINSISFDLKKPSNNFTNSGNFGFAKNTSETSSESNSQNTLMLNLKSSESNSQNTLMLNLKSISNGVPMVNQSNDNGKLSEIGLKTKNNEKEDTSSSSISNLSAISNIGKGFIPNITHINNTAQPKEDSTEKNPSTDIILQTQTTKSSSVASGAVLFGSIPHVNSNKFSTGQMKDQNSQSKGGFAFGNDMTALKNTSNMSQISKASEIPATNTFTVTGTLPPNVNSENLQPSHQPPGTFSFRNNQSNNSNEGSNILTKSQQNGQTTSTFSFTSTTKNSTPALTIGNTNLQSNLFQFGNVNSSQKVFPLKNVDSSNNKPNIVFESNSFNSPASNGNNLFGNLPNSSINVFDNNIEKSKNDQMPVQENKVTIFGSPNTTSLPKSVTTFNFNNNIKNSSNPNANTPGIFSFGSSNISNGVPVNNNPAPNFTFGGNNNTVSNTFGNINEEEKSNAFTTTTTNSLPSIFGSNNFGNSTPNTFTNNKITSSISKNSMTNTFNSNNQNSGLNSFNDSPKPNDGKYSFNQFANNATTNLNNFSSNNNNYNNTNNNINNIPDQNNTNNISSNNNNNINNNKPANNINNNNMNNSNNPSNAAFSFSGLSNTTGNVFSFGGGNTLSTVDTSKSPNFNFSGNTGNGSNVFGTNNNSANIFNTGPITDRPIRKATRRLNK